MRDEFETISELQQTLDAETENEKPMIQSKLVRLAESIDVRQQESKVLGEERGQARRLAKWGLVGTIVFGVLSVGLALMTFFRPSSSADHDTRSLSDPPASSQSAQAPQSSADEL